MLTANQFGAVEQQLLERRHAGLNRRVPQPLIRLWDKKMQLLARVMIPESWDSEEIAHDDGVAHIELVGKDNDWLREIICFDTRPAEDLHITIDPDPEKPHDFKNRWSGKVDTIEDDDVRGQPVKTTLTCVSNRKHLEHIYLAATPLLPEAVQPIKMFLWAGNCVTACSTAVMINLARIYTLNAFSPIPRNIFDPQTWLENLSPLNWPVQVMPKNPIFDQSRFVTFASRWKDAKTILTPVMKDAGVICHAYQWLPGDPAPYTAFGPKLAEILKPTRACVILDFVDESGVGGPTGTAIDGLLNLFAATADDLITESLINIDADGDGLTDPFIRKILGVAPKRPPFVYRDVGYGGAESRKMVIHKAKALRIITGGKSPQWVNQAITFAIRYGISQLANAISNFPGAPAQVPGSEGLDNLYQGQLDDTLLAFMSFLDPLRGRDVGPYGFNEYFETGSGSAFTINSIMTLREGWWKTRPYTSFKFDIGDGSPYEIGSRTDQLHLGSRCVAERRGILYTDQIMAIKRTGSRYDSNRPTVSFGDDMREEDPMARGFAAISNVANFAAMLGGSGDLF